MKSVVALLARRLTIFCPSELPTPAWSIPCLADTLSYRFDASFKSGMAAWVESWARPLILVDACCPDYERFASILTRKCFGTRHAASGRSLGVRI